MLAGAPLGMDRLRALDRHPVSSFQTIKAMTKHHSDSAAFERQVAQEFVTGETLHRLSKRHDISRQLIDPNGIRLMCGKHGALFELGTGTCVDGPCKGRSLTPVALTILDNDICVTGVTLVEEDDSVEDEEIADEEKA